MNERNQIKAIIKAAHSAPRKIAVIVDSKGKEERFLKAFGEALSEAEFKIYVMNFTKDGKVRCIFIERLMARNAALN